MRVLHEITIRGRLVENQTHGAILKITDKSSGVSCRVSVLNYVRFESAGSCIQLYNFIQVLSQFIKSEGYQYTN